MKKMLPKIVRGAVYALLAVVCLAACALFTFLPFRVLDSELVYKGF